MALDQLLTTFAKSSISDACMGSKYPSPIHLLMLLHN